MELAAARLSDRLAAYGLKRPLRLYGVMPGGQGLPDVSVYLQAGAAVAGGAAGKGREGRARQGKARHGKGREAKNSPERPLLGAGRKPL
jgi:hypothetical protein